MAREQNRGMGQSDHTLWAMMKRGYHGVYHKMSPKHMNRDLDEYTGRHNVREYDTEDQMAGLVAAMEGKRLTYKDLVACNGLNAGTRCSVDNRPVFDITWKRVSS